MQNTRDKAWNDQGQNQHLKQSEKEFTRKAYKNYGTWRRLVGASHKSNHYAAYYTRQCQH